MANCSKCGKLMEDDATFCSSCGTPLQNQNLYMTTNNKSANSIGLGVTALVFGIVGLLAWIIPIIGLPVGIVALVLGILGIKKSSKGMSIAGIVLGVICLVLTIINSAIGAYQGYHGEAWFQKRANTTEEKTNNDYLYEEPETNVFTLRDKDGNILMTGGIVSTGISAVNDGNGTKSYTVEIMFTDEASKEFAKITEENIGEQIGIYLNEEMIANPTVMSAITGGSCNVQVSTYEEAQKLADALEKCE